MKTYRVGIVGLTGIAAAPPDAPPQDSPLREPMPPSHAAAYAVLPQTRVVAVCDLKAELLDRFRLDWQHVWADVHTYTDYREMIAHESLDVLSVVTSDHCHADIVVDAANAGIKGILCEKPIATTLADADRMIEAVERNGAVMTVEHTRRWHPLYHQARALVRQGDIGELRVIVAHLGGPRAMLFRNGTHLIDMICFFAESEPAWVFAELDPGFEDYFEYRGDGGRDPAGDPGGSGYIHFRNGVRAFVNCRRGTCKGFELELIGTDGEVFVGNEAAELWTKDAQGRLGGRFLVPPLYMKSHILGAVEELIHLMEHGGTGISTGHDGRRALEIIIGFLTSQKQGNARVELPLPR
ncbi:MAG: Gfo/Idh/MocA family oxidoreductase [Abditibacteriales bacterium]|nr:Gfo/Idh/MocA family oxidoreductase [Abditibacteriales bacterium]MDW8366380.1 Gfo/Idh/MocA family oxidoreductase [Abditibacteriales bacterium]